MAEAVSPRLPSWVRILDALALVALVVTVAVAVFGGFSTHVGFVPLSARSPLRLGFITLALVAIRHAAFPSPPIHQRALEWARTLRDDPSAAVATTAWFSRVAVLVAGYFAVLAIGVAAAPTDLELSPDPVMNLPSRFDAGWYGGIALDGYHFQGRFDRQQNIAFFPAYPFAMRALGHLVGGFEAGVPRARRMVRTLWAGVILSIALFVWGASYLARLARDTIGEDRAAAAVALIAAYPFAIFFSVPYTESMFLLGAVAAFYHFRRREWGRAAAWGALVGLTRPNGCFLSVALACLIVETLWRNRTTSADRQHLAKALLAASAPGLGMLAYSAYVHELTGSWFGWARLHEAWGRSFQGLAPLVSGLARIEDEGILRAFALVPFDTLNALALVFALVMVWPVFRRLGFGAGVFVLVNIVPPLLAGGVLSMGRFTSTLFPTFLALAAILPRRFVLPFVTAFGIGEGLVAALFFTYRPMF